VLHDLLGLLLVFVNGWASVDRILFFLGIIFAFWFIANLLLDLSEREVCAAFRVVKLDRVFVKIREVDRLV
jgi:hypothetical protein